MLTPILGSGEFYLLREGSEKVHLVVRTINSSAFTAHDWDEYVVSVSANQPRWNEAIILTLLGQIQLQHQEQGVVVLVPSVGSV